MSGVLARAAGAWQGYFFAPAPASDLGLARAAFFALAFCLYLPQDFSEWGTVAPEFWMPIPLFKVLSLPLLPAGAIAMVQTLFKLALALAAIGLFTRVAIVAAFGCSLYLLGLPQNFGQVQHFDTLIAIVCGILAVSRAGDTCSVDAWLRARRGEPAARPSGEYTWPIRAIWVMTAVIFFSAGFAKLRHSGLSWVFSDHLAIVLVRHQYFVSDGEPLTAWGLAIAAYPWAPRLLAAISLATEVLYPLSLFSRRARMVLVPSGIGFLIGIRLLMGPTFEPFVICNVFWLPWTRLAAKVGAARRSRAGIPQPAAAPAADSGRDPIRSPAIARTAMSATSKTSPP